ncbi:MAG: hypothetical protein ACRDN0_15675 [Trebonia sp.]
MPANWHDSAKKLFEENAGLASEIMRELLDADLPPGLPETVLSPVVSDQPTGVPIPGTVILVGHARNPLRAIILEFQATRDDTKRRRWPHDVIAVWQRHDCPVDLLVVCPDDTIARWWAEPIRTTLRGYTCHPRAVSLSRLEALLPATGALRIPTWQTRH